VTNFPLSQFFALLQVDEMHAKWAGPSLSQGLKAEELPKKSSDHGVKDTFPPDFVEMRAGWHEKLASL